MKCLLHTKEIDPTSLYKSLTYAETRRFTKLVTDTIYTLSRVEPFLPYSITTKTLWITLKPDKFFSFDLDIEVQGDPEKFRDSFHGPLTFYNNQYEYLLARSLFSIEKGLIHSLSN